LLDIGNNFPDNACAGNGSQCSYSRSTKSVAGQGFRPGDTATVVWNASDPDILDKLTFTVHISTDNGESWNTLASEMIAEK
jgi:hypothetical protein